MARVDRLHDAHGGQEEEDYAANVRQALPFGLEITGPQKTT